jgi:PKD repeat protein
MVTVAEDCACWEPCKCTISAVVPETAQAGKSFQVSVTSWLDPICGESGHWAWRDKSGGWIYRYDTNPLWISYDAPGTYTWTVWVIGGLSSGGTGVPYYACSVSGTITVVSETCTIASCAATVPAESSSLCVDVYGAATLSGCDTTNWDFSMDWGDQSSPTGSDSNRRAYHCYASPGNYNWKMTFYAYEGSPLPKCERTGTIAIGCTGRKIGTQLQVCADGVTENGDLLTFQGNVRINEKLFATGDVTFRGTPASGVGTLTVLGDLFVKLQKGNTTILRGPSLEFRVEASNPAEPPALYPNFDPKVTYALPLAGLPLYTHGLPIRLTPSGVETESIFFAGVSGVFTVAEFKCTERFPHGGKRTFVSGQVANGELTPSLRVFSMTATYDPDLDKLEGTVNLGFPKLETPSVGLGIKLQQGCLNGYELSVGLPQAVPLFGPVTVQGYTTKIDGICFPPFKIFMGGSWGFAAAPDEVLSIADTGVEWEFPFIFRLNAGTLQLLGYPLGGASGYARIDTGTVGVKANGNIGGVLKGDLKSDILIGKLWLMGQFSGEVTIPDFSCHWINAPCRATKALLRKAVTLPYTLSNAKLDANIDVNIDTPSYGFFRGYLNLPGFRPAMLFEYQNGAFAFFLGTDFQNLYCLGCREGERPELFSNEQPLTLNGSEGSVVFSVAGDSAVPSVYLRNPSGQTITPANVGQFAGVTHAADAETKVGLYRVETPAAGTWVLGVDNLPVGEGTFLALAPKAQPAPGFTSVTRSGNAIDISVGVAATSAQTRVDLYWCRAKDGSVDGLIASGLPAYSGSAQATWDISQIPSATYYLMAVANDGMTPPATAYYTQPVPVDHGLVPAPTGLAGTRSGSSVSLTWTPGSRGAVQGYEIRYTDEPEVAGYPFATTTLSPDSAEVGGLDPSKGYRFCIAAFDDQGNASLESNAVTFPKPGGTPGDCDGDGQVSIGEVQKAINMFLGSLAAGCSVDTSGDGTVSIGEVQKVINAFLGVVPGVSVSVSPSTTTVAPYGTQQFTASVTGTTDTAVAWSVQEGASGGTVTGSGLYTAPATAGTYHVLATSQADTSKSASATVTVTQAPTCTLSCTASANPASGTAPLAVNFTATATPSNCSGAVTYAWAFGDGTTSTQQNPTHTYAAAGTFGWTMTASIGGQSCTQGGSITAADGGEGTPLTLGAPVSGTIQSPVKNGAWDRYYVDLASGSQAITVDLYDMSADLDLYVRAGQKPDLTTFDCRSWTIGSNPEQCAVAPTGPVRLWIGVTNFATGTPVTYTVKASSGGTGTCAIHSCLVFPDASAGLEVHFGSQVEATGCTGAPAYFWIFGDGGTSAEENPVHTFPTPGTYTWSFAVTIQDQTCDLQGSVTVSAR